MYVRSVVLLAACAVGLGACGGEDDAPARSSDAANRQAELKFAQCMREQGIEFPDPGAGSGGPIKIGGDASPEEMREAEKACEKYREDIKPPELTEEQQQEFKEAALEHARCMREHGVDFPDPTFSEDGGARVEMKAGGADPEDEDFKEAERACADKLGGMMERRP